MSGDTSARSFLVDGRRVGIEECRRLFEGPTPSRMRAVVRRAHGPRLLDVGCYDGRFLLELKTAQPEIEGVGVDYDAENIEIARTLHPELVERVRLASAYELPFEDRSFDCVTFQEVIEHLEGAALAVKELNRVLRPDGTLIVSTPNAYFWRDFLSQARSDIGKRLRRRPPALSSAVYFAESEWNRHIYSWTPVTLLTLLQVNGFKYSWHGYCHDEQSPLARLLLRVAPTLAPVVLLEVRKNADSPRRQV
jgi:SAM-dependent methyltransferase